MKKKTKYLDFYNKCMETGKIPTNGLCLCFKNDKLFALMDPDNGERLSYWGFDRDKFASPMESVWFEFTPTRQNAVLLMAAMNDEL
jgi:hypothetical protein